MVVYDLMWLYLLLIVFSSKNSKFVKLRKFLYYKFLIFNLVYFEVSNKCCKLFDVIFILFIKIL